MTSNAFFRTKKNKKAILIKLKILSIQSFNLRIEKKIDQSSTKSILRQCSQGTQKFLPESIM